MSIGLDKKLKDKFKLFENIDETIENKESLNQKKFLSRRVNNISNDTLGKREEIFSNDKIFIKSNSLRDNNIINIGSKQTRISEDILNKDIFYKLHNEKQYLIDKREKEVKESQLSWRKGLFKPSISDSAKKIVRNPNNFHERLYTPPKTPVKDFSVKIGEINKIPNKKSGHSFIGRHYSDRSTNCQSNSNLSLQKKTISDKDELHNSERFSNDYSDEENNTNYTSNLKCNRNTHMLHEKYSFKPKISDNSLKIARLMNYSPDRIFEAKKRFSNDSPEISKIDNKSFTLPKNECIKVSHEIYKKGVLMLQNKAKFIEDQKKEIEKNEPKYSFDPFYQTKNSCDKSPSAVKRSNSEKLENFIKRNTSWTSHKENNKVKIVRRVEEIQENKFLFKPKLNTIEMKDDEEFILKRIEHINDYVSKRRSFINTKKQEEDFQENKYTYKMNVSERKITNLPVYNYSLSSDRNRVDLKEIRSKSPSRVLDQRKQLGTSGFFDNSDLQDEDQLHCSNIKYNDVEFKEAVRFLTKKC